MKFNTNDIKNISMAIFLICLSYLLTIKETNIIIKHDENQLIKDNKSLKNDLLQYKKSFTVDSVGIVHADTTYINSIFSRYDSL